MRAEGVDPGSDDLGRNRLLDHLKDTNFPSSFSAQELERTAEYQWTKRLYDRASVNLSE